MMNQIYGKHRRYNVGTYLKTKDFNLDIYKYFTPLNFNKIKYE